MSASSPFYCVQIIIFFPPILSESAVEMLLRSSSTPLLGSLLSSFSDSPNHHQNFNKIPCLTTIVSCNSTPMSSSMSESSYSKGIRRAQSDGNLEGLVYPSNNQLERSKKLNSGKTKSLMLETIPSFSLCNLRHGREDYDEEEEDGEEKEEESGFGLRNAMENMGLNKELTVMDRNWDVMFEERNGGFNGELYLAKGIGVSSGGNNNNGNGGSGGGGSGSEGGDGGDINSTEEYYKKMVKENPGNPLFLRNYAHLLYQKKQDLEGAEEYYSRAILADAKDGEILSQYAKLVWELHGDEDRASTYFERAVQAAPEDSHVHAAYASFLWETEEDDDECIVMEGSFNGGAMAAS